MKSDEPSSLHEVVIVGAGPIGIQLAVNLKLAGVDYLHLDAQQIGYTMSWWPRDTTFFSTTERIEIAGVPIQNTAQARTTGEEYLAYLRSIVEQFDLPINTYEPVVDIQRTQGGDFLLTTQPQTGERFYKARKVVLASGDMHRPHRLGIPGEDLSHVSHYFRDVHPYFRRRLLIVGGRNSAAEAALRCWRAGAQVTLSYRRAQFNDRLVKHWILPDLHAQIETGMIGFHPLTAPLEITPSHVVLARLDEAGCPTGETIRQPADFVLLLTGFEADMTLFEQAGVTLEGPSQTPRFDPATMETDVPGLYVAGTAAAGQRQEKYTVFIENSHVHVGRIVQTLTGRWPDRLGTIASRQYELALKDFEAN
jgi:thioredoxin reductase (NADPH)